MTVSEQDANRKPELNSRKDATREPDSSLSAIELELNRLHRSIRLTIQDYLRNFEGKQYPSLEENQRVVSTIQRLLERYGLRVRCPECGNPSILRVSSRKTAKRGVFVFDHNINGKRTFHGGKNVFPKMQLVEKPGRRLKKPQS